MKVKFTAALHDSSGYSEASRNYLCALDTLVKKEKIELCATSPKFEMWHTDVGPTYRPIIEKYCAKTFEPDLHIIHLTPDCYLKNIKPGQKTVAYAAWETSKLPEKWLEPLNAADEIWVPSDYNVEVFKSSGVTKPVYAVPHAISVPDLLARAEGQQAEFNIPKDKFIFYSIYQWTPRKNPEGLLKAFFSEFTTKDPVCLVVKSYVKSYGAGERDFIRSEIQRIRKSMHIDDAPPVVFIGSDLSSQQIAQLHQAGDCMVFPTRAEGFSLTAFEAMAFGKPVITTNYSGHLAFMNEQNSYLTDYQLTPCAGMPWPLYTGRMSWAEPNLDHLKKQMRHVFENRDDAAAKGRQAAEDVNRFSWDNVGKIMIDRMETLVGGAK